MKTVFFLVDKSVYFWKKIFTFGLIGGEKCTFSVKKNLVFWQLDVYLRPHLKIYYSPCLGSLGVKINCLIKRIRKLIRILGWFYLFWAG